MEKHMLTTVGIARKIVSLWLSEHTHRSKDQPRLAVPSCNGDIIQEFQIHHVVLSTEIVDGSVEESPLRY